MVNLVFSTLLPLLGRLHSQPETLRRHEDARSFRCPDEILANLSDSISLQITDCSDAG
jgi:hypothetical protein